MLALDAQPFRNERRRDLARVPPLAQRTVEDVSGATCFMATSELALAREALEIAFELRELVRESVDVGRRFAPIGSTAIVMESLWTSMPR